MTTSPGSDRRLSDTASRSGVAGSRRQRARSDLTGGRGEPRLPGGCGRFAGRRQPHMLAASAWLRACLLGWAGAAAAFITAGALDLWMLASWEPTRALHARGESLCAIGLLRARPLRSS
jgi:hypothetical protein